MDTVLFTDHGIVVFAITTGAIALMLMLAVLGFATTHRTRTDIAHQWLPVSADPINRQLGNMSGDAELNEWNLLLNQFHALVRKGSDSIEDIFDAQFLHRFSGVIDQATGPTNEVGRQGRIKAAGAFFGGRGLKTREVKQPCPAKTNYSSSRSCSIRRPVERKHPTQNGLCIEWANTTKTKLPMRRIATPNDNGNSGSLIATPSRLHKAR